MKTRKFTAMLLTLAMAFSLLTVSAGAVMDNDHDRISVDTAGPLSVVWDSETVDSFSEEFEPVETPKQEPQAEDAEEARKKAEFDVAEAKTATIPPASTSM